MKGLRHSVIEINDTGSENIEKVLVFLKPHTPEITLAATRAQATQLLSQLEVRRKRRSPAKTAVLAAAALLGAAVIFAAIIL